MVGAAIGAAFGAATALRWPQKEPWWHDAKNVRTFDDVAKEDAAFQAAARSEAFDAAAEGAALQRLFDGSSATLLTDACASLNSAPRLEKARLRWLHWKAKSPAAIGAVVESIVDELDAPHLKPSGIEQRLQSGVKASSFGLLGLMDNPAFAK